MKSRISILFLLAITISLAMISCEKNDEEPELSEAVKKYLGITSGMNALNAMNSRHSRNENANMSGNFMAVIGMSQFKEKTLGIEPLDGEPGVSDGWDPYDGDFPDDYDFWDFHTCATVTETINDDGTVTTVYDYGDGCEEWGSLMRGKITYTWFNEGASYSSTVVYENYYSYGIEMNGYAEHSFSSDGNSYYNISEKEQEKVDFPVSDIYFNWSGESSSSENISVIMDSGEKYSYTSVYQASWDNHSYTLIKADYTYIGETEGYRYDYSVIKPLYTDYTCENTWVPVSGIETINFTENGIQSIFSIDYGNGKCDNLATILENGKTSVIDFGKLIDIYFDDDTVVSSPGRGLK